MFRAQKHVACGSWFCMCVAGVGETNTKLRPDSSKSIHSAEGGEGSWMLLSALLCFDFGDGELLQKVTSIFLNLKINT